MLCDEFIETMNRLLDERSADHEELLEHTRCCSNCRSAWETFQQYEQALASREFPDEELSERVLGQATHQRNTQSRRKTAIVTAFATTAAAGLLALAGAFSGDTSRSTQPSTANGNIAAKNHTTWPQWYASTELPSVDQFLEMNWADESVQSSVTASVSAGFRPVANTMSSAFQVIRQNVLRVPQPTIDEVGEQASLMSADPIA